MSSPFPKAPRRFGSNDNGDAPRQDAPRKDASGRTADAARPDERPDARKDARPEIRPDRRKGMARPEFGRSELSRPDLSRQDEQAPLLPGLKPVLELLESTPERVDAVFLRKGRHGRDMARIVDLCRMAGVRFSFLEAQQFTRVYEGNSQGVVARLFETGYIEWEELLDKAIAAPMPLVLALDRVQDPGNAGTLARTLYALGGAGIVTPRHNGVYLGAAAAKASAGALEHLPVSKVASLGQALDRAKKLGFTIYGASGDAGDVAVPPVHGGPSRHSAAVSMDVLSSPGARLHLPAVLILGSEEDGLRSGMIKRCDALLRIPLLRDFDSLNVAQAGAIILSCFARKLIKP